MSEILNPFNGLRPFHLSFPLFSATVEIRLILPYPAFLSCFLSRALGFTDDQDREEKQAKVKRHRGAAHFPLRSSSRADSPLVMAAVRSHPKCSN